jgi:hypothetical protein
LSGLSSTRRPEERARIIDAFYQRYEDVVADAPTGHGMDYVYIYLICAKQA